MDSELNQELTEKMDKSIAAFDRELGGLRTGRASSNLLNSVQVDAYGSKMPISQVATVSTPDAVTISVQVWDTSMAKAVEKGIAEANLGLNPICEGQLIRINMPPLSEERRAELVKVAYRYSENSKISVRNIRKAGMDSVKKMEKDGNISEDEMHKYSEEIQKMTDSYIKTIESKVKSKEEDIMKI